ncbi:DUF6414 family protein [Streptococcus suis]|uniref:DUF6414 family protein n=1 Tax=Streptococcus suis TaxID=1307 RepID=UPI0015536E86|nr:DUF6414 family protein [Streptococcus suis]MBM7192352.1 hypothetical protein [Streptococcus suis]MBO4111435.1 hypothetical protein [Streptococcus suis]MCO8224506.1 DUF6414 family protein [Streptococcus suis]NQN35764.1 hypothetical protein [Streptococcus suis]HEM3485143.1 hypothetical protein [Streptococcus suis]
MAKNTEKKVDFLKIIYFDEESATDLIYMYNKGQIIETLTAKDGKQADAQLSTKSEIGAKTNIFSFIKLGTSLGVSAELSSSSAKLVNQAITNTVLTDYLNIIELSPSLKIEQFYSARVYPYKGSMSFYKLMTPYLTMTQGAYDAGNFKIDIQLMDSALKEGRGYFEMILKDGDIEKVLRFNLKSFKSSYSLSDLVKMTLTYHAVKVGEMNLLDLDLKKEFIFDLDDADEELDGAQLVSEEVVSDYSRKTKLVGVYDVILAGVKND